LSGGRLAIESPNGSKTSYLHCDGRCLQIARVLGAVFLVVQIILILDFMFAANDYLVDRDACRYGRKNLVC